jgi:hypothetical protein
VPPFSFSRPQTEEPRQITLRATGESLTVFLRGNQGLAAQGARHYLLMSAWRFQGLGGSTREDEAVVLDGSVPGQVGLCPTPVHGVAHTHKLSIVLRYGGDFGQQSDTAGRFLL